MLLIPAIDLKNGRCVRLRQGNMDDETVFSDDPVATATRWVDAGARRLHIVDLDGAVRGAPENAAIVGRIVEVHPQLDVQIGGGIRQLDTIRAYLDVGVSYVIIGTQAVRQPEFVGEACHAFPGQVIVGLDARDGRVAIDGWSTVSSVTAVELVGRFADAGVAAIVFTDIGRDGMMQGANCAATRQLARQVDIPVIASGGVSSLEDVRLLCEGVGDGVEGAIIGRALYEGGLDLREAQSLADQLVGRAP